jgi:cellulose synthase/poly-beta-1,6-N-acetylglucosamine synthase-like glycosyltransferase
MLNYPEFEVIVVNDGSKDRTLEVLIERFGLRPVPRSFEYAVPCRPVRTVYESPEHPNLVVVDKENGGKADALNAGLNLAFYPLFCAIDADSVLEEDALLRVVRPFVEEPGVTVATGGIIRIANGCEVRAGRIVEVRLPRASSRWSRSSSTSGASCSGAWGGAPSTGSSSSPAPSGLSTSGRAVLAGGYAHDTVGEDMELVVRMHRRLREEGVPYRVRFVPDPVCWTEAPESLRVLRRQRNRWHRGLIDTLWRHRAMLGRPRFGTIGLLAMPSFLLFEMLGPLVELSGYLIVPLCYVLGILDVRFMLLFLVLAVPTAPPLGQRCSSRTYLPALPRARDLVLLVLVGILGTSATLATAWWRMRAFCGLPAWDLLGPDGAGGSPGRGQASPRGPPGA